MALTRDERLVLRYLASGRSIEEIAATLNWPLQAVRWTCTHPLVTWVLDELEASATPADSPWAGREVSQGRAIVDYIARRRARRAAADYGPGWRWASRIIPTSTARSVRSSLQSISRSAKARLSG
jgi:hypothetical protein